MLRPIYNYRQLNQWTIKNHYPLPLISKLIYRLQGCNRFTTFDIRDGYHNLKVKPEDIWKGAFLTNRGLFEPVILPFRMCNAPASFQAITNSIFRDFIDEGWLTVYMDDIIVHMTEEESLDDHRRKVYMVLDRLEEHDLYLRLLKCSFEQNQTAFLGIIISHQSVVIDLKKLKTVTGWGPPRNVKGVQRFLGFTRFYRHFVKGYSEIV
jgi:hypothetical protein